MTNENNPVINIFKLSPASHNIPSETISINIAVPRSGCLATRKKGSKIKVILNYL